MRPQVSPTRRLLNRALRLGLLGALGMAPVPTAFAASQATTMPINASVLPSCVISAGALNFGAYDPIGANATTPLDGTATITVQCIRNTTYSVTLSQGANGTASARNMLDTGGSGTLLQYELYKDSSHSTVWNLTNTVGGTASSRAPIPLTVYGRIPAAQDVIPATYSDTVAVTVNF